MFELGNDIYNIRESIRDLEEALRQYPSDWMQALIYSELAECYAHQKLFIDASFYARSANLSFLKIVDNNTKVDILKLQKILTDFVDKNEFERAYLAFDLAYNNFIR